MDESLETQIRRTLGDYELTRVEDSLFDFYMTFDDGERLNFRVVELKKNDVERSKTYGRYGYHTGLYRWFDDEDMTALKESNTSPVIFIYKVLDYDGLYYVPTPKDYQQEETSTPVVIEGEITVIPLERFPEVINSQEVVDFLDKKFERSIPSRIAGKLLNILGIDTQEMMPGVEP